MWSLHFPRRPADGRARGSSRGPQPLRRKTAALRVENLEDRRLLSAITLTPKIFTDSASSTSGSLRAAIIKANAKKSKDPITIQLKAGTYTLSLPNADSGHETASKKGDLNITNASHELIIQGVGSSGRKQTIIKQTEEDRVLEMTKAGIKVTLRGLIIQGGQAIDDGSDVGLEKDGSSRGGGILSNGAKVTLSSVVIRENKAVGQDNGDAQGGGIYAKGGSLTMTNVKITSNSAIGGDGFPATATTPTATGTAGASGQGQGAGLYAAVAKLRLDAALRRKGSGAGVAATGAGSSAPGCDGQGGGIYADGGSLTMTKVTISNNRAVGGKGFVGEDTEPTTPTATGAGAAYGQGAGLYAAVARLKLNATQRRTGVTASAEGETTPTAPAETAAYGGSGQGGGIYLAAGKITFIQGAVMQNTAIKGKGGSETAKDGKAEKGGVFVEEGATFKAVRSTISGNKP